MDATATSPMPAGLASERASGAHPFIHDNDLRRMLLALQGVATASAVLLLTVQLVQGAPVTRYIAVAFVLAGNLGSVIALRRGQVRRACQLFLGAMWAGVLLQSLVIGGLSNPALFAMPVLVLAVGWLLGLRAARWITVGSVAAFVLLGALQHLGSWTFAPVPPPLRQTITLVVLLSINYLAMRLLIRSHWRGMDQLAATNHSLTKSEAELRSLNESLAQRVAERSAALTQAQLELVEAEKFSALARLVSGIAHELNTPLGVAVSATSAGQERLEGVLRDLRAGTLKRSELDSALEAVRQGSDVSARALARAAELVGMFKQVSADQVAGWRRSFDVAAVIGALVETLGPELRVRGEGKSLALHWQCPPGLTMDSYPGALGQIVMNLVINAKLHAFDGRSSGRIDLKVTAEALDDGRPGILLVCEDNGTGIPEAAQRRVFEPFFTTRLGAGGTGLGLSVSRSLATGLLGGRLNLAATSAAGTRFALQLPMRAPEPEPPSA